MEAILKKLEVLGEQSGAGVGSWLECGGETLESVSPINGQVIGRIRCANRDDYERVVAHAIEAFQEWRMVPAPKRGDIIRQIGDALRAYKKDLGALVSLEMGKIRGEGEGEVQEMVDIADFALGQSRMLYGSTMHSWKPSSKASLSAIATMKIAWRVLRENGLPDGILSVVVGRREDVGEAMIKDTRIPLISATGSVGMGRHVGQVVVARLGKTILELGGNNAVIVTPSADLELTVRAIVFGAVGTAGQRCTTTRRVIAHKKIYEALAQALIKAYRQVWIGNPLEETTLMGPLIDRMALEAMQVALQKLKDQGGRLLCGGEVLSGGLFDTGTYVRPCICEAKADFPIVQEETFAPILYLIQYETLEEAIRYQNAVPQGLSSAIFTDELREAEAFLSHLGSDCGIANVNIGTSGAEIGGAFGGEKDTGGGREAGSDAWKAYMRRQTCTVNWSRDLPLAQGIRFEVD